MKKAIFIILVISFIQLSAQTVKTPVPTIFSDTTYLKKYYVGFLYNASALNYYTVQDNLSVRLGAMVEAPLIYGTSFLTRIYTEPLANGNTVKADGRIIVPVSGLFTASVGSMPTATRELRTPNPISPEGHFLPGAKGVISPGFRPGIKLNTSNVFFGVYVDGRDAFQYHIGYKLEDLGPIKSLKLSAFALAGAQVSNNSVGGGAIAINFTGVSLMAYSDKISGIQTHSGFLSFDITNSICSYTSLVYKDKGWQSGETGILKSVSQSCGPLVVNYSYGLGFQYLPYKAINFYVQTWLN